jgi:hypothetical protein
MMTTNPNQVQENLTEGQERVIYILAKNIGCDIFDEKVENISFNTTLINALLLASKKGAQSNFIRLNVSDKCRSGEYRGSIIITAKANRIIFSGFAILPPLVCPTRNKTLAEVPFFFRITPSLNPTFRTNGITFNHDH